jgi:hypothetical protein
VYAFDWTDWNTIRYTLANVCNYGIGHNKLLLGSLVVITSTLSILNH